MKIAERREVSFEVDGTQHPIRVERANRRGVDGFVIKQLHSWVFISDDGLDDLISAVELIDGSEQQSAPQLGQLARFPQPEVVTPAKWVRGQ